MNYTVENSLITGLFWNDSTGGTSADEAATLLSPEDFTDEGCRAVFRAILKLREQNLPVELSAALEQMILAGFQYDQALPWLVDSTNGAPQAVNGWVSRYAAKIKDIARAKQLTKTIGIAGERVLSGHNIAVVKTHLIAEIERIESEKTLSLDRPIADVIVPTLNSMADRLSGDQSKRGMQTGIPMLDATTTGLNAGEFWICGAMPGRGKTAFSLQVAMNVAGAGHPVFIVSMEMSSSALVRRLMKMHFGSSFVENPNQAQWKQIIEYGADLKSLPLFINESASLDASEIAQHARVMVARSGVRLIIVDYLQIIRGKARERRDRVGDAADVLRILAKDTGVPVLALSQLKRPDNLNDRPTMIDLKESGDLEAHAHVVLLSYMPTGEDGAFMGEEELIIGKQREGPIGSIPVFFDRSKVTFRERTRYDQGH